MCAPEAFNQRFTYFFSIPLFLRKQKVILLFNMYCSSAFPHFFQKHFYFSATFLLLCSISSTLSNALSLELRRGDHAPSPWSRDIYSTIIGPFYFIHFNIFFLPYKLRFLRILHPKPTLHTKFTAPCSPIYAPRSPIHACRSLLAALHSHASDPQHLKITFRYRLSTSSWMKLLLTNYILSWIDILVITRY